MPAPALAAIPILVSFAEAAGIVVAGVATAAGIDTLSKKVEEYVEENPEQSQKILAMIMPAQGIANILKNESDDGKEVSETEVEIAVEEKPKLTGKEKGMRMRQAALQKKGNYSSPDAEGNYESKRGRMIRTAEELGLADPDLKDNYKKSNFDYKKYFRKADGGMMEYANGGGVGSMMQRKSFRGGGSYQGGSGAPGSAESSSKSSTNQGPAGGQSTGGSNNPIVNRIIANNKPEKSPFAKFVNHDNFTDTLKTAGTPNYHQLGGFDFMKRFPSTNPNLAKGLASAYQNIFEYGRAIADGFGGVTFEDAGKKAAEESRLNAVGIDDFANPESITYKQYESLVPETGKVVFANGGGVGSMMKRKSFRGGGADMGATDRAQERADRGYGSTAPADDRSSQQQTDNNNRVTGNNTFMPTVNPNEVIKKEINKKLFSKFPTSVDNNQILFDNMKKYQTLNKNLPFDFISRFQLPKTKTKNIFTNNLTDLNLLYPDIKIEDEYGMINADKAKSLIDRAVVEQTISPVDGLNLTRSIDTTGTQSNTSGNYTLGDFSFNSPNIEEGILNSGFNYNLGDLNLSAGVNTNDSTINDSKLGFNYDNKALTGSTYRDKDYGYTTNKVGVDKEFNIGDNFKVGLDGSYQEDKFKDGSYYSADLTPSLTYDNGIFDASISKEIVEGGEKPSLGIGFNKNGFYANANNLLSKDRTGTMGYKKEIGNPESDLQFSIGAEKNLFDDNYTGGVFGKYIFQDGGRVNYNQGSNWWDTLDSQGMGVYNSMKRGGHDDATIQSQLQTLGYYDPNSTPDSTPDSIQPNIVNQLGYQGGDNFSPYNPDPSRIKNVKQDPAIQSNLEAIQRNQQLNSMGIKDPFANEQDPKNSYYGDMPDFDDRPGKQSMFAKAQQGLRGITGKVKGLMDSPIGNAISFAINPVMGGIKGIASMAGNMLPANERVIQENIMGNMGFVVNDIGQIVSTGDYDDPNNVMAGYNLNRMTPATFKNRIDKIMNRKAAQTDASRERIKSIREAKKQFEAAEKLKRLAVEEANLRKGRAPGGGTWQGGGGPAYTGPGGVGGGQFTDSQGNTDYQDAYDPGGGE